MSEIPVLSQPAPAMGDKHLLPIGTFAAESDWDDNFGVRHSTLIENIREAAPEGTTIIYHLRFEYKSYHGHQFLRGMADAYMVDPDVSRLIAADGSLNLQIEGDVENLNVHNGNVTASQNASIGRSR